MLALSRLVQDAQQDTHALADAAGGTGPYVVQGCVVYGAQQLKDAVRTVWKGVPGLLDRLEAIEGKPGADWADVREAARKAGWTRRTLARDWIVWTDKEASVHVRRRWSGGWKIALAGDFGDLVLNEPSPARFLTLAHLVGLTGSES